MRSILTGALVLTLLGMAGCGSDEPAVIEGVQAIVFAKRAAYYPPGEDGTREAAVSDGARQVFDYQRYVPGGGLYLLSPPTASGELTNLTEGETEADFNGLDVSFDGKEVVFSMRRARDDRYHLYLVNVDDPGTTLRQITFGNQDDVHPIFLPGDRVGYMSNPDFVDGRPQHLDEYVRGRAIQLATIKMDGTDRLVCSENLSHSVHPFLRADGRIGYSRWEHLGLVNDAKLFAANPDCTQMVALGGQHGKPANSIIQAHEYAPNQMIGIGTTRERTIQAGAIVRIDSRASGSGAERIDEENARFEILTPGVPTDRAPSPVGRYQMPFPMDENRILVSWAQGEVNTVNELVETPPDFGIYMFDARSPTERLLVYNDPETWDLYAHPLTPREIPPVISPGQNVSGGTTSVRLDAINVADTSLGDQLKADLEAEAVAVRVIEGFSGEIGGLRFFGLTQHEGASLLGEGPIYGDGSFSAFIPPSIPVHLQALDEFGIAIRSERLWIQGVPGEARVCGGCHERRTGTISSGITTVAQQAPSPFDRTIAERTSQLDWDAEARLGTHGEVPWDRVLQPIFDARCIACHNETTNGDGPQEYYEVRVGEPDSEDVDVYRIPRLDLTSRSIEVQYESRVITYPASHISLLMPTAIALVSIRETVEVVGEIPPPWIVPESARESVAIQMINTETPDGRRWIEDMPLHPEDVGVEMTPEERYLLIFMADAGGQFFGRSNTEGPYGTR